MRGPILIENARQILQKNAHISSTSHTAHLHSRALRSTRCCRTGIIAHFDDFVLAFRRRCQPRHTGIDAGLYPDDPPPVIAAHDSDAIVVAVEKLRNDSAEMARLSNEGRQWVCRNHGYAHHLEILEKAYFG